MPGISMGLATLAPSLGVPVPNLGTKAARQLFWGSILHN